MGRYRYRQMILFLTVLLLPGILIFLLLRDIAERHQKEKNDSEQEQQEVNRRRDEQDRQRVANEFGQNVLRHLDRISYSQATNAPRYLGGRPADYGDAAVVVVGAAVGDR